MAMRAHEWAMGLKRDSLCPIEFSKRPNKEPQKTTNSALSRVIVRCADGKWAMVSQGDSLYTTTDLSLMRFGASEGNSIEIAILTGLNAMLQAPRLTRSSLQRLPNSGDLYCVQLPEGADITSSQQLLYVDPMVLGFHRASAMHVRDALEAVDSWGATQLTTDPARDFRSARRGVNNTRD
jgi:hypothetical protein